MTAQVVSPAMKPEPRMMPGPWPIQHEPDQDRATAGDDRPSPHRDLRGGILAPMPTTTDSRRHAAATGRRCGSRPRPEQPDSSQPSDAARPRTSSSSSGAERRLPRHRPVARAAHPVRVRRGLRCAGRRSGRRSPSSGRPGRAPDDPVYELARTIGRRLAEAGYAVITGGGPGAMEAANRGCQEGGGLSIGCNIELPHEQGAQPVRRPRRRVPLLLRAQDRCS